MRTDSGNPASDANRKGAVSFSMNPGRLFLKRKQLICLLAATIMAAASLNSWAAQAPGSSPQSPASAGIALTGIVECGQGYTSHELYDMKITLVEAIRGEEAWKRLKEASPSNKAAQQGFEYVLARVKFEYYARGTPGLCVHQLDPKQFIACSSDGSEYEFVDAVPPKPEMRKAMRSGETIEGWIAFAVSQKDKAPLMTYSADQGGAIQHGGAKWFLLR
jgi:hypothetical protein